MTVTILRALVVEDDPSWQQILNEILTDCGLAVDIAESQQQALEYLHAASHRIAVLDLSLGGLDHLNQDGLKVLEAIRRHDPGCVAVFLTGFATVELAVKVIQEYGAYTCLRKETFKRAHFSKIISQAMIALPVSFSDPAPGNSDPSGGSIKFSPAPPEGTFGSVLVVEDDASWRSLLGELLNDSGFQVRTSSSFVEAMGLLLHETFSMAVIDLSLASSLQPGANQDGLHLLATTQKAGIPTIIVSGYADPMEMERAYTEFHLFACLEKQAFDRKVFKETVRKARQVNAAPILQALTPREREVLALIASGMTNKEIAQALYITPNTVKKFLKSLFIKLEVPTRSAASAAAIRLGVGKR